jgi:hypothetical protein
LAAVDLNVRVQAKTGLDLTLQGFDLLVQDADDRDQGPHGAGVGGRDQWRLTQLFGAQGGHQQGGLGVAVAAAGAFEDGADLGAGQPGGADWVGGLGQQLQHVRGVKIVVGDQGGGEKLPKARAQPLALAGAVPDHRLVHPGHDLDCGGLVAVPGHGAQLVGVGADQVGQDMGVTGVALGPRHPVASTGAS